MAQQFDERLILKKFFYCRSQALGSREWKAHTKGLRLANRMLMGDQAPPDLDASKHDEWYSFPLMPAYVSQLAGLLSGGSSRVHVRGRGQMGAVHEPVALALMQHLMEDSFFAGKMNRAMLDLAGRGLAIAVGNLDFMEDPDGRPVIEKAEPGQVWFSPHGRGTFDPQLGSHYVGYEFLSPQSIILSQFNEPYHVDIVRKMKSYTPSQTNPIANDEQDPLYSQHLSMEQFGSGPMSLYDFDVADLDGKDTAFDALRLYRRTRFFWIDNQVESSGKGRRKRNRPKWYQAEIIEPDGSGDPRHTRVLWAGPCRYSRPPIVIASPWNNGDSPFGKSVYAAAGDVISLIDASMTIAFTQLSDATRDANMLIVNEDIVTDTVQRQMLKSKDRDAYIGYSKSGTQQMLPGLNDVRNADDVITRLKPIVPNAGDAMSFVASLMRMLEDIIGLAPQSMGRTGTPGQRLSGPVADALQSASRSIHSPNAFVAKYFQTNVGRMGWNMIRRHTFREMYVPQDGAHGGFTINKNIPLEAAESGMLAHLARSETPEYNGEFAFPNGLRGYTSGVDMPKVMSRPNTPANLDRLLDDPNVTGVNVVINDVRQTDADIQIVPESDYQERRDEFIESLAIVEQYRAGQISTERIMNELFRAFPEIDAESELRARLGESGAEKWAQLDPEGQAFIDSMIDQYLQQRAGQQVTGVLTG